MAGAEMPGWILAAPHGTVTCCPTKADAKCMAAGSAGCANQTPNLATVYHGVGPAGEGTKLLRTT